MKLEQQSNAIIDHGDSEDHGDSDGDNDCSFDVEDESDDAESSSGEKDLRDTTIKLVRLLANLTIDPIIGAQATGRKSVLEVVMNTSYNMHG
jgi:hypothetical protein